MRAPTIFIASSEKARPLADALANLLRQNMGDEIVVRVWWINCFTKGRAILASLLDLSWQVDFAVVLLTQDVAVKQSNSLLMAPRENCIFESGMFMGAWGDPRRCFLLSSIPFAEIFSDAQGIVGCPIADNEVNHLLQIAESEIREAVKTLGPLRRPELHCYSEAEVLEREKVGKDLVLENAQVLINLKRPIEVDSQFAERVMGNLKDGVTYRYYFSAGEDLQLIARLVRSVAMAGSATSPATLEAFDSNLPLMEKRFRISLLPKSKPPEFCIHNALRNQAICYLRRPEDSKFVEWCRGEPAIEFAKDIQGDEASLPDSRVFRSSKDFDLYGNRKVLGALRAFVKAEFDDSSVQERVLKLCFGEESAGQPPKRPAPPAKGSAPAPKGSAPAPKRPAARRRKARPSEAPGRSAS